MHLYSFGPTPRLVNDPPESTADEHYRLSLEKRRSDVKDYGTQCSLSLYQESTRPRPGHLSLFYWSTPGSLPLHPPRRPHACSPHRHIQPPTKFTQGSSPRQRDPSSFFPLPAWQGREVFQTPGGSGFGRLQFPVLKLRPTQGVTLCPVPPE